MFNPLIKILLVGCALLGLLLLLEWFWLTRPDQGQARLNKTATLENIQLPQLDFSEQTLDRNQQMVSRPLFIKGRRPIEDAQNDEMPESSADNDEFLLMGVYQVDDKPMALIKDKTQQVPYLKKTEGETIAGWEIKQILPDRIVVERSGSEKIVALRKPKPKTARIRSRLPNPNISSAPEKYSQAADETQQYRQY